MAKVMTESTDISALVNSVKVVAIVGVSDKPDRASHQVAKYLQDHSDYSLYFVNPLIDSVLGQTSYKSLSEIPVKIDLVDVFRKAEDMAPIMDEAIAIGATSFWMQLGIRNDAVAEVDVKAGLNVVQDLCLKVELAKYKN